MRNTFISDLLVLAKNDKKIVLLTGDLGYGVVDDFALELPKQFINFGINEQTMMGAAAGLAKEGFRPFVYSIGNFPTFRCMEQIRNDVCFMDANVTIVAVGAGFSYGNAGYSHHLIEDISAISGLPNIKCFSPADEIETTLVVSATLENSGPKYVRLGKGGEGRLTEQFDHSNYGYAVLIGESDTVILSTGSILTESLRVLDMLSEKPTLISVYDLSLVPSILSQITKKKIITLEEHILRGGFGSIVREKLEDSNVAITSVGIRRIDSLKSGSQDYLREVYELKAEQIIKLII